jgi:hypothetical protein
MNTAVIVLMLSFLVGCDGLSSRAQQKIANEIAAQSLGEMNLEGIAGIRWSRVCFFGPYTPPGWSSTVLGLDWDVTRFTDIEDNEGMNIVVFASKKEVFDFVPLARKRADFWKLSGQRFNRGEAIFYYDQKVHSYLHR